jgi:rhodanese-related sulfurtransferase
MKKYISLILILIVTLTGCMGGTYQDVSIEDAKTMVTNGEVQVIDVRTPEEFSTGHIPDAELIPLQVIDGMLDELDKDKSYLIVCRSGNRSSEASAILAENGFTQIYNMTGGMNQWDGEVQN